MPFLTVALDDKRYKKLGVLKKQFGLGSMNETLEFLIDGMDGNYH